MHREKDYMKCKGLYSTFFTHFAKSFFRGLLPGLLAGIALVLVSPRTFAIDLTTASTDGAPSAARFSITITSGNTPTELSSVVYNTAVTVKALIRPDPQHANKLADVFAVDLVGDTWYMRDTVGRWTVWSGNLSDLKPAREAVNLGTSYTLDIYQGSYVDPAQHSFFVGYLPAGRSALLYTPEPASLAVTQAEISFSPLSYYGDRVENEIMQTRCIACHVGGGVAKGSALILERSSSTSVQNNFATLKALVDGKGANHVLAKASGGNNHGGLVQLVAGSSDYDALSRLLGGMSGGVIKAPANDFFDGVSLEPRVASLRRAAIMLAGRAPTSSEQLYVAKGDEAALRIALRDLLKGPGFHQFLTETANDRLLLRGTPTEVIDTGWPQFQTYVQAIYTFAKAQYAAGKTPGEVNSLTWNFAQIVDKGLRESPGELIAYIAENDRPYTEIVTADYMMMNPRMSEVFEAGLTFANPSDQTQFKPGKLNGYYHWGQWAPDFELDREINRSRVVKPSTRRSPWPHAGILNSPAFLARYPSTATNRNRARARWALYHFLDIDIEKSVQRPTDPAALADLNNPTMNNPACTACHERMDPVAAAFQDYADRGQYRVNNGDDSLDNFYKWPPNGGVSLYQRGDTWYRDMRAAGLFGQGITMSRDPVKQLAEFMVKDPGFARAAVKFWWPAVMNAEVLAAPAVSSDTNYQDKLTAYQAQAALIEQLAAKFSRDWNLRNLLVDMMMSPWFRAESNLRPDKVAALELADVGTEKLLTPERLYNKTLALTGFGWGRSRVGRPDILPAKHGFFTTSVGGLYGGIDSFSVTQRQRTLTPLMSTVAQSMANESACPIVLRELMLPDAKRLLFNGIALTESPLDLGTTVATLPSRDQQDWHTVSLRASLPLGTLTVSVGLDNPYCDYDALEKKCRSQRVLYLDRFEIKGPGQASFQPIEITSEVSKHYQPQCYRSGATNALTFAPCRLDYTFTSAVAGEYEVRAVVAGPQAGTELMQVSLKVQTTGDPLFADTAVTRLLKQKLVDLHSALWGGTYTLASPEIADAWSLFVAAWQDRGKHNGSIGPCNFYSDQEYFVGTPYPGDAMTLDTQNGWYNWDWNKVGPFTAEFMTDSSGTKRAWVVVMAYLLGHYNYLYE